MVHMKLLAPDDRCRIVCVIYRCWEPRLCVCVCVRERERERGHPLIRTHSCACSDACGTRCQSPATNITITWRFWHACAYTFDACAYTFLHFDLVRCRASPHAHARSSDACACTQAHAALHVGHLLMRMHSCACSDAFGAAYVVRVS